MSASCKTFVLTSGLPRAGSTLLQNLLHQNPRFHATSTSGVLDVMIAVRNGWDTVEAFKSVPNNPAKKRVVKGILENFYADIDRPIICEKSRGWLAYLEMYEALFDTKAKVLVPVRDIRDVIASFEKLYRKQSAEGRVPLEQGYYVKAQTAQGRAEIITMADQPVGIAVNRIEDALRRGFRDRMHFVRFEELTTSPDKVMAEIYNFLGEEYYKHNFDNVEPVNKEDDTVYGYVGLHTTRRKVEPVLSDWQRLVGDCIKDLKKDFI